MFPSFKGFLGPQQEALEDRRTVRPGTPGGARWQNDLSAPAHVCLIHCSPFSVSRPESWSTATRGRTVPEGMSGRLAGHSFHGYLCTRTALEGDTTIGIIVVEAERRSWHSTLPAGRRRDGDNCTGGRGRRCSPAPMPYAPGPARTARAQGPVRGRKVGGPRKEATSRHLLDNFFRDRPELPEDRTGLAAKGASRPCPPQRPDPMDSIEDIIVQHHRRISEQGARKAGRQELEIDIVEGESYLVEEQGRKLSYGMFASMVDETTRASASPGPTPASTLQDRGGKPACCGSPSTNAPPRRPSRRHWKRSWRSWRSSSSTRMSVVLVDDLQYLIGSRRRRGPFHPQPGGQGLGTLRGVPALGGP